MDDGLRGRIAEAVAAPAGARRPRRLGDELADRVRRQRGLAQETHRGTARDELGVVVLVPRRDQDHTPDVRRDLPPDVARKLLGAKALIGWSVSDARQTDEANRMGDLIDYVGVGPVFYTPTKPDAAATSARPR